MIVAFYKAKYGNWKDKLIAWLTHGPYCHCEVIFMEDPRPDFGFSASSERGVIRTNPSPYDYGLGQWNFIYLPQSRENELRTVDFYLRQVGKPYDWLGVFHFVLGFIHHEKGKWFCSDLVAAALEEAGIIRTRRYFTLSPNSLYRLIKLEVVH